MFEYLTFVKPNFIIAHFPALAFAQSRAGKMLMRQTALYRRKSSAEILRERKEAVRWARLMARFGDVITFPQIEEYEYV